MNLVLAMIVISEACLGICVWITPDCLRRVAAQLLTRADVIETARAEHRRRIQFWRGKLGVPQVTITRSVVSPLESSPHRT